MKRLIGISVLSGMMLLGLSMSAAYAKPQTFGEAISSRQVTAIKDILSNPKAFEGKKVTIEGTIAVECPSGCWFYLKVAEGNAAIYVDIGKSGFAIPQKKGSKILVEGEVLLQNNQPMIQGRGVELK